MIKNSALAVAFGVLASLMGVVDELVSQQGLDGGPVFLGVVIGYLVLTIPLGLLLDLVERSQKKAARR
jgi:glutamate transport system permease protein